MHIDSAERGIAGYKLENTALSGKLPEKMEEKADCQKDTNR